MNDNDELLTSFLNEIEDHYEEVSRGIDMIKSNHVSNGIDTILRPLHSIKGTSGFVGGLEPVSEFTHKVEDYLKEIQNGKIQTTPHVVNFMIGAVENVFTSLDQVRNGKKLDVTEGYENLANIDKAIRIPLPPQKESIHIENKNSVVFLRVKIPRVHLPGQYHLLTDAFKKISDAEQIVLDLASVYSIGSTAWGSIWQAGKKTKISIIRMNETCRTVFTIWGFDKFMEIFESEEDFWENYNSIRRK